MAGTELRGRGTGPRADPPPEAPARCGFCRADTGQRCRVDVVHRAEFPSVPVQASSVRRYVRERTARFGVAGRFPMDDVDLVITETFTNAVKHADNAGAPVTVGVEIRGELLRLEVHDRDPHSRILPRRAAALAGCGRGLLIVAALTHRWGVLQHPDGKVVFAEFAPDPGAGQRAV